jgi:hypothetical protein
VSWRETAFALCSPCIFPVEHYSSAYLLICVYKHTPIAGKSQNQITPRINFLDAADDLVAIDRERTLTTALLRRYGVCDRATSSHQPWGPGGSDADLDSGAR